MKNKITKQLLLMSLVGRVGGGILRLACAIDKHIIEREGGKILPCKVSIKFVSMSRINTEFGQVVNTIYRIFWLVVHI